MTALTKVPKREEKIPSPTIYLDSESKKFHFSIFLRVPKHTNVFVLSNKRKLSETKHKQVSK